jgi:molybdopterin-guanine dinucleotide biosynthesis protein A
MSLTGIVLAGGASRRMGRDKAWVELDGKSLVVRVIDVLDQVSDEMIVVTNNAVEYEGLDVRVVPDAYPGKGSLGGLYSGLSAAENERAFAVACDMPFLNIELVQFLIARSSDYDVIIPAAADEPHAFSGTAGKETAKRRNLHPLHALYRKSCLASMRDAIERDDLRMISFHDAVRVLVVEQTVVEQYDPQHLSFWNVNTIEELQRAEQFLSQQRKQGANHA